MCRESNKWWGEWLSVWLLSLVSTLVSFRERGGCWGKLIYQGHHHCIDSTTRWDQKTFEILLCKLRIESSQDLWGIFQMFWRAKFWTSKVILIYVLEMISFKLVGSNLVPLCRQSFSMAMANQLHLLFKRKTYPFNVDLIQWDRKHLCFIIASLWWSIVTFLLISLDRAGFSKPGGKSGQFIFWQFFSNGRSLRLVNFYSPSVFVLSAISFGLWSHRIEGQG